MDVHGWTLYWHRAFQLAFTNLLTEVIRLSDEDPDDFDNHPTYKLYESLKSCIINRICMDPNSREFYLGDTFREKSMKHWRRAKNGLPSRYRLFFQFHSEESAILLAWFNDCNTLRKEGAKTDVYAVFKQKVKSGKLPNTFDDLFQSCQKVNKLTG